MTNSRNIGLDHGAGKGDKNRSNHAKFVKNYPDTMSRKVSRKGFERRGRRLVKVYGPRATAEHLRPVMKTVIQPGVGTLGADLAVAQKLCDQQNATFRAQGFDTQGH